MFWPLLDAETLVFPQFFATKPQLIHHLCRVSICVPTIAATHFTPPSDLEVLHAGCRHLRRHLAGLGDLFQDAAGQKFSNRISNLHGKRLEQWFATILVGCLTKIYVPPHNSGKYHIAASNLYFSGMLCPNKCSRICQVVFAYLPPLGNGVFASSKTGTFTKDI